MRSKGIEIKKEIKNNSIIIFSVPGNEYSGRLEEIVGASAKAFSKICYVSLNKPYDTLVPIFKKLGIETGKMIFVDCVTAGFRKPAAGLNVVSVSSPKALTEINITINKISDSKKFQGLVFDSLSTLLVYEQPSTVIKFSHSVISKLRAAESHGVFMCLREDLKGELMKDLSMFVDRIVEL